MDTSRRSDASEEPEGYQTERIRQALAEDPRVGELDVHVQLHGDVVYLTGNVPTAERRAAVTTVVRELLPDVEVRNDVSVTPFTEPTDQEVLS